MATLLLSICKLCLVLFLAAISSTASSFEFEVGGDAGWTVPTSKNTKLYYNHWASKNRFQIGDTINFKYEKDSVMVVTEKEYERCSSAHPAFYSNNGNTEYKFDHSGTYYFISGIAGHCERGQKMIIKVMGHSESPVGSPPGNGTVTPLSPPGSDPDDDDSSGVVVRVSRMALFVYVLVVVISACVTFF